MEDKARFLALKILSEIDEKKAFSNIKLNQYYKKYNLSSLDRAFATEVVYGTLRWKLKIDYLIQKFCKRDLKDINIWALNCIRIGVYQIFFMNKVPEFAAVSQSVNLCKIKAPKLSGFVNGILRNILRNKQEFENINEKNKIKFLSIKYSHPEWYVDYFIRYFDEKFLIDLMEANNKVPELTVRVNTLKSTKNELKDKFIKRGIKVKDGQLKDSLIIEEIGQIEKMPEFLEGLFYVQDQSSMLAAIVLNPKPGEKVLDMCAAPGGKTTHMAQLMENKGEIIALDVYEHKINLIKENSKRLGVDIIEAMLKDASIFYKEFENYFDKVLLDAPCSGLGLIRKKPEIRWNVNLKDIYDLTKIQYSLLKNASIYVKINGEVLYSTCTITKDENEKIIESFLNENPNFELLNINELVPEEYKNSLIDGIYLRLFPNVNNTDGFFICKLKRLW
ncbi:MAG: 16S rRNA (cytosine(967)-C(5))-methyltransferase RsmB [Caloramator sp.]|nr:16S rRNA (cytosine(967)-C(5))-methyltransferase RsmB [Caloramator sp.]